MMTMLTRVVAALAVLVSAYVHLHLWIDGVKDQHVVGPAFLLNAVAGVLIAILLIAWRTWVPLFLALGFGATTIAAFVIAATVGLYGVHEHWQGAYVWTAFVAEALALLTGAFGLWREGYLAAAGHAPSRPRSRPVG
jgi:hypothetical protein